MNFSVRKASKNKRRGEYFDFFETEKNIAQKHNNDFFSFFFFFFFSYLVDGGVDGLADGQVVHGVGGLFLMKKIFDYLFKDFSISEWCRGEVVEG